MVIKPIKAKRVADQVFEQLREHLYKGDLRPGDRLAPERNLAASMDVSRTSVRIALDQLVQLGMLEHRPGEGVFVAQQEDGFSRSFSEFLQSDAVNIDELLEVRLGLECNAAELAAKRATGKELESLVKSLEVMEKEMETEGHISTNSDTAFHMAIIFASRNLVLMHLMRHFYDSLFIGIKSSLVDMKERTGTHEDVLEHHRKIYEMIAKGDSEGAGKAMHKHLLFVKEFYAKNIEEK